MAEEVKKSNTKKETKEAEKERDKDRKAIQTIKRKRKSK